MLRRATLKAVDAAMNSRQWNKAVQILDVVTETGVAKKYYQKIAEHYVSISEFKVGTYSNGC